jgi:uncharacterized SAM-binding protein YcdF (DUF218 family)
LAVFGLLLLRRRPRMGRAFAWLGVASLLVLSVPMVALQLHRAIDDTPPFLTPMGRAAQAIVILGSACGTTPSSTAATRWGHRRSSACATARAWRAPARVACAGRGRHGASRHAEAQLMRDALEQEFGVPVRWIEDRSRNTHENAVRAAEMLEHAGVRSVVLVAHSIDMPRARNEFAAAGLQTIPAPVMLAVREFEIAARLSPGHRRLTTSYRALLRSRRRDRAAHRRSGALKPRPCLPIAADRRAIVNAVIVGEDWPRRGDIRVERAYQ